MPEFPQLAFPVRPQVPIYQLRRREDELLGDLCVDCPELESIPGPRFKHKGTMKKI